MYKLLTAGFFVTRSVAASPLSGAGSGVQTTGTLGPLLLNFSGVLICSESVVRGKIGGVDGLGGEGLVTFFPQCYQRVAFLYVEDFLLMLMCIILKFRKQLQDKIAN